jgi:inorganic pyrophosphatase
MSFDFELGLLCLRKVLPPGFSFPFPFGSIPGTRADDGDPLDLLLLVSEDIPAGGLVAAKPIGVMKAEQREKGQIVRNDRILGVRPDSVEYRGVRSVSALAPKTREELEWFFEAYAKPSKEFRVLGWLGPAAAWSLIEAGRKRFRPSRRSAGPGWDDYLRAAEG